MESKASQHLNAQHKQQVIDYLKYFRHKREQNLAEVQRTFDEVKDTRLLEDLFTRDDVSEIIDALKTLLKGNISTELENFCHTSVLFLRQLFLQAEGQNVQLRINTAKLDDEVLLSDIEKMDIQQFKDPTANLLTNLPLVSNKGRLESLSGPVVDTTLVTQIKELKAENERSLRRLENLKQQLLVSNQERENMLMQIQLKESQIESYQRDAELSGTTEVSEVKAQLVQARIELSESKKSLEAKVSATTQFQELRRIVTKKNEQIKTMKNQLLTFDPNFTL